MEVSADCVVAFSQYVGSHVWRDWVELKAEGVLISRQTSYM